MHRFDSAGAGVAWTASDNNKILAALEPLRLRMAQTLIWKPIRFKNNHFGTPEPVLSPRERDRIQSQKSALLSGRYRSRSFGRPNRRAVGPRTLGIAAPRERLNCLRTPESREATKPSIQWLGLGTFRKRQTSPGPGPRPPIKTSPRSPPFQATGFTGCIISSDQLAMRDERL